MRRIALLATAVAVVALPLVTASSASADERRCYTLGAPGFDRYEVCRYLPIDPELEP